MTKVSVIAFALVAVFTGAAVGEPALWRSMMTDIAFDDEGRITGRSPALRAHRSHVGGTH
jgi:uncharacterized protein YjeT (DUF2065 family)